MHRPFQTALLFVAGSRSWQSTTTGIRGKVAQSWYLISAVPLMSLRVSFEVIHVCHLFRL